MKNNQSAGKTFEGVISSTKMQNTVIVTVVFISKHPLYKKIIRKSRRFAVHNTLSDLKVGDTVKIRESKPISKTKHFVVVEKINK